MAKRILVSYLERNKVLVLPEGAENDVQYLKTEFLKTFKLIDDITVDVIFQKFDDDWDTYVDIEDGDKLVHKDKLRAVVTHAVDLQQLKEPNSVATSIISVREVLLNFLLLFNR